VTDYTDEIEKMKTRLFVGRNQTEQQQVILYAEGTKAKIRQSEYALYTLKQIINNPNPLANATIPFDNTEKVYFYVDSFFAFLYSSFDVVAHVINIAHSLGLNEHKVSFKSIETKLRGISLGIPVQVATTKIVKSNSFKNIEKYRNCSTHRRQIYLKKETVTISETPGYSLTAEITKTNWTLCDDALTLKPKTNQKREVINFGEQMLKKVKAQISEISKKV